MPHGYYRKVEVSLVLVHYIRDKNRKSRGCLFFQQGDCKKLDKWLDLDKAI